MKKWIRDNRGFLLFLLLLGVSRTALADWNRIQMSSMQPNLLEGDLVFVNRIAYDLKLPLTHVVVRHIAEPHRGDIVTFNSPQDDKRLVKRVIGLPGDTIEMRHKVLAINGQQVRYEPIGDGIESRMRLLSERTEQEEHLIQWQADAASAEEFGPVVIPENQYLMLGDNRDHSGDSRHFGLVPRHLLIGRAERILVSMDVTGNWLPRFERFGQRLN